ncbi:MAG: helix-turn-helix transcriptional regulator, partial [Steroidobacteraceae bacterium]
EQFYLGYDPETQIEYGGGPEAVKRARAVICDAVVAFGQRSLARASGVAREQLRAILKGKAQPRPKTMAKLLRGLSILAAQVHHQPTANGYGPDSLAMATMAGTAHTAPKAEAENEAE